MLLVDSAALQKVRNSKQLCQAAGWGYLPFVEDTCGTLRYDALNFLSAVIYNHTSHFVALTQDEVARSVWSSLSSAVLLRATYQLSRHMVKD